MTEQQNGTDLDSVIYFSDNVIRGLFLLAAFINLLTLFYAWIWIMQISSEEAIALKRRIEGSTASAQGVPEQPSQPTMGTSQAIPAFEAANLSSSSDRIMSNPFMETSFTLAAPSSHGTDALQPLWGRESSDFNDSFESDTHNIKYAPLPHVSSSLSQSLNTSSSYNNIPTHINQSTQQPASVTREGAANVMDIEDDVEALMPIRAKLVLNSRFGAMVNIYVISLIVVILFSEFAQAPHPAVGVTLDVMNIIFMIILAYLFRVRPSNPYFQLNEYDDLPTDQPMELQPLPDTESFA
jgi:hypothetical protein